MEKIKVYVVVCSYITDDGIVNIELDKMLERLRICKSEYCWGTDHNIQDVIRWNIDKRYRVKYIVTYKYVPVDKIPNLIFHTTDYNNAAQTVEYMTRTHDTYIRQMSDAEAELKFRRYGNDYTKQIKGGK